MAPSILTTAVAVLAAVPLAHSSVCPPLGPVLLAPRSPSENPIVKAAVGSLKATFDGQIKAQMKASAVSVAAKSLHENNLLFNYHFTPPTQSGLGTTNVDENTMYRVGSVSKLMPVLALLQDSGVSFEDPITKYIPGLRNATGSSEVLSTFWDEITIGALASHLSGLATDFASDLAIFPSGPWKAMGLPDIPKGTGPTCSGIGGTRACNGTDLVRDLARRPPVYREFTTPVYSNVAYALLGMVVEARTNKTFDEAVKASIFDVLGMKSTKFNGPPDSFEEKGFIPVAEATWNATLGAFESAGGMFSSTSDLITFSSAILNHRLLSAAATRKWLQPLAFTTASSFSVGAPWEIGRSDTLTVDGRTIDVYTKTGDLGAYHAVIALVQDYDLVVTVMTGGQEVSAEPASRTIFLSTALRALIPALEKAGRDEAASAGYVGVFADEASNSSLVLASDGGPGLVMQSFNVRGFNVLGQFGSYSLAALETASQLSTKPPVKADARLYPTDRRSNTTIGAETAWRVVVDTATDEQKKKLDDQMFYQNGSCVTWFGMDRSAYNFLSLADFVIVTGFDGSVTAIKNPAFGITLARTNLPIPSSGEVESSSTSAAGRVNVGGHAAAVLVGALLCALAVL